MAQKGVLLVNLGTPDDPSPRAVYRYLRQFLNDPRVIDLPSFFRWILTNLIIVPFRHRKSAAAYQKIWMKEGSPLLYHSTAIKTVLAETLGPDYRVEVAMRYGNPSISSVMKKMKDCTSIQVVPLFPQYSSAATGSAMQEVMRVVGGQWNVPQLDLYNSFYDHPGFIAANVEVIQQGLKGKNIDKLVFSYHGLPERHIDKSTCVSACDRISACPPIDKNNEFCYRAQCYKTSALIAQGLGLKPGEYEVAFQSRLGRTPWIKPYTDLLLPKLRSQGVKNIAVVSPSFVADCLETLEEINMRTREQWQELGGGEFYYIPCINENPTWIKALAEMIAKQA